MNERLDLKDRLTNYFRSSNATTVQEVVAELYQEARRSQASEDTKTLALAQAQDQAMEQMERVHALEERVRLLKAAIRSYLGREEDAYDKMCSAIADAENKK